MTAVDTNVVVRLVTADDADQLQMVLAVFRRRKLYLPKTVLLETEWVLRYCYQLDRGVVLSALRRLLGFRRLVVEDRAAVLAALDWYEAGLDFADGLHLASAPSADRFATFDRPLAKRSRHLSTRPPVELLTARGE